MKKIILFGTGNLGKRYLQAILSVPGDFTCSCYDINPGSVNSVDEFLFKNNVSSARLVRRFSMDEILNDIDRQSLVIVATTAGGRVDLVSRITERGPEALIIEKPVAQTRDEYVKIAGLCKMSGIKAYTHYTLRFQPFCKELKNIMSSDDSFEMTSILPAMGIACVSIHYIDLFLWLFNIKEPRLTGHSFSGTYEQKRTGFYDMYGELIIESELNGTGRFINSRTNGIRTLDFMLQDKVISVYEDQRLMTVVHKADKKTPEVKEAEYLFASKYLSQIIINYLSGEVNFSGELVSLDEAYVSHNLVYNYMEITGNKNLNIT